VELLLVVVPELAATRLFYYET